MGDVPLIRDVLSAPVPAIDDLLAVPPPIDAPPDLDDLGEGDVERVPDADELAAAEPGLEPVADPEGVIELAARLDPAPVLPDAGPGAPPPAAPGLTASASSRSP